MPLDGLLFLAKQRRPGVDVLRRFEIDFGAGVQGGTFHVTVTLDAIDANGQPKTLLAIPDLARCRCGRCLRHAMKTSRQEDRGASESGTISAHDATRSQRLGGGAYSNAALSRVSTGRPSTSKSTKRTKYRPTVGGRGTHTGQVRACSDAAGTKVTASWLYADPGRRFPLGLAYIDQRSGSLWPRSPRIRTRTAKT